MLKFMASAKIQGFHEFHESVIFVQPYQYHSRSSEILGVIS